MDTYLEKPDAIDPRVVVSDIVKEYPGMLQIVIYHNNYALPTNKPAHRLSREQKRQDNIDRSTRRTRTYISDIILCNKFDLWVTFTFSGRYGDRYNPIVSKSIMSRWLHKQQYSHRDMKYIIVPEQHKRCKDCVEARLIDCSHDNAPKALHFHALISGWNGKLKDSGKKTKRGQPIYNIPAYRSGFTEVVKISQELDDTARIAQYIQKYITKEMLNIFGKKRYWCSQNLNRPQTYVNGVSKFNLWKIVKDTKPIHINHDYEMWHIPFTSSVLNTQNQTSIFPDVNNTSTL